jgi:ornithine lipid ester-linked acyl 2-hydroxylase
MPVDAAVFYDPADFPFSASLEASWKVVLHELTALGDAAFQPWPETHLYGRGWDAFGLYLLGNKFEDNCRLCPETTRLVEAIPGMKSAGFSALQPGTHISPHVGYSHELVVCHLALVVPDGCGIRVGGEVRHWTPGKCLIFNDMVEHEAWNRGPARRVVLLMEVTRDGSAQLGELAMSSELGGFVSALP